MTFHELIIQTLKKAGIPLTVNEIWLKAGEYGYQNEVASTGKTPERTIGARIYTNIKKYGQKSKFIQISKRPAAFGLRNISYIENSQARNYDDNTVKSHFIERDLHKLLSTFVFADPHFGCYTKTIYHEKSMKKQQGENEWLHPDMVGIYYPFENYCKPTIKLLNNLAESQCRLFSFEIKIAVNFSNLRKFYFQAVSNSSWANEGYLVALQYDNSAELFEEMLRLNNAFGIGFIMLDIENIEQSDVLITSKEKSCLDWDTINRLAEMNPDFLDFIQLVSKDIKSEEVRNNNDYDEIFTSEDQFKEYLECKNIKCI